MACLDINQLKIVTEHKLRNSVCDFCHRKLDMVKEPFIITWIDNMHFHKKCFRKLGNVWE